MKKSCIEICSFQYSSFYVFFLYGGAFISLVITVFLDVLGVFGDCEGRLTSLENSPSIL